MSTNRESEKDFKHRNDFNLMNQIEMKLNEHTKTKTGDQQRAAEKSRGALCWEEIKIKIKISRCVCFCVCGYKTKHKKREILPLQKIKKITKNSAFYVL